MSLITKYSSIFCDYDNITVKNSSSENGVHHLIVYDMDVPVEEYLIKFKRDEVSIEKKTIEGTQHLTETGEDAYKFAEMFIDCGYML